MSRRPTQATRRRFAAAATLLVLLTACATGEDETADGEDAPTTPITDPEAQLAVAIASFDLAVGDDQRLLAGVFSSERQVLGFGDVVFQLGFLGDQAGGETEIDQSVTADFLAVPGREPEGDASTPTLLDDPFGQGVYAGRVDLDQAGMWGLRVLAEIDGTTMEGRTTFMVADERQVVDVGQQAPRSVNLTIADVEAGRAAPAAVDSRAQGSTTEIPAPHLHDKTVADSLEAQRPVVVAITTPVYCVSQFCGPLTEVLADMALEYEDRADMIHIEVWEDFEGRELNAAAAEWIQTEFGGNEPWVFLIDGDGAILQRWDNVLDVAELEAMLDELPVLPAATAAGR